MQRKTSDVPNIENNKETDFNKINWEIRLTVIWTFWSQRVNLTLSNAENKKLQNCLKWNLSQPHTQAQKSQRAQSYNSEICYF